MAGLASVGNEMDGWNIASNIPLLNASTHRLDHDPLPAYLHAHMLADGKIGSCQPLAAESA
jgi:hypothetical protein